MGGFGRRRQPGRSAGLIREFVTIALAAWCSASTADMLSIRDDTGRTVRLEAPARRIVTLSPHATELVVAAGASAQLVAAAAGLDPPAGVQELPRIGGPGPLDRERLLTLRPDLVVAWQSGNRPADLDWIARSGIAVYRSEPTSLGDISRAMRAIGVLSGHQAGAARAAAAFDAALQTPCTGLPRLPVYVEVWRRPALSLGGRHWLNSALHAAGWQNMLSRYPYGVIPVAAEAAFGAAGLPRISLWPDPGDSAAAPLADLLSRPGPRLAEAVQVLCRQRLRIGDDDGT